MPENLTRREFIGELGKLGAAASLVPMVAAGESMATKPFSLGRPGWIKELDEPLTEVDWQQVARYNERHTTRRGFNLYVEQDRIDQLGALAKELLEDKLKNDVPGYTLKDRALQRAARAGKSSGRVFMVDPEKFQGPDTWGVPKWEGTPEEASQLISAALRHMGAATVGFVELQTETTEKFIYSVDPDGKELRIEDVEMPEETEEYRVIPKKARYAIVYTVQMSEETMARCPTVLGSLTTSLTYTRSQNIQDRAQAFLHGLGYMGLGESSTNALGISPALGVYAGLGELSRYNRLLTPEYGPMVRVFKMLTDLPLAPTKPIDAGLYKFCHECKKCADACPGKALSFEDEPSWETRGGWNNPGHRAWFEDSVLCRFYQRTYTGTNCGLCFSACPFATKNLASFNRVRNYMAATMPAFDKTFKSMDDLLYTNFPLEFGKPQKDCEEWWTLNLPDYGIDTVQTVRHTS